MKKNYTEQGTRWISKSVYVDLDTGEEITKWNAEKDYLHVGTDKHVKFNYNKTCGYITFTKKYCKNPQLKLL